MNHLLKFVAAVIALVFGGAIVWFDRHALTMGPIIAAGVAASVGFALALGTDFGQALAVLKPYLPLLKNGSAP